jgi:hypothetical protein
MPLLETVSAPNLPLGPANLPLRRTCLVSYKITC